MFEQLSNHKIILVTGSQRSGTTICARMIAHDTGHIYIDEEDFAVHELDQFKELIKTQSNIVIHCPAIAHRIHEFSDCFVVWMIRPIKDILASMERICWLNSSAEMKERIKYSYFGEIPIAKYKNDHWLHHQRPLCKQWLEVQYSSLKNHELWLDDRGDFNKRQWK